MKLSRTMKADLALIGVTFIWGSSFTIVKQALAQVSPLVFIALRFAVATATIGLAMPRALRGMDLEMLRRGLVLAGLLLAGFVFQTLGLRATSPSKSAFITSLSVLLVPLLGYVLFRHRPRVRTLGGVALATVGLGFLTLERLELRFNPGDGLTFVCAVAFALHILFIGRYAPTTDFRKLVLLQVGASAAVAGMLAPIFENPFLVWDLRLAIYVLITGVLGTALGFYVQNRAQQFTTANRTALIFALEPIFAALFAYVLLDHTLNDKEWFGAGLVLAGVLVSEVGRD
jgi:drug/metabolite transporter (DMT)-like permease